MKKRTKKPSAFSLQRSALAAQPDREGSVIVVVLALLLGLLFLGILLFTDTSQEEINAEYFAGSAKVRETTLDADQLFNDVLRQIILGANDNEKHSPFYGGRMSLLPTMFGKDQTPFNGEGIRIVYDSTLGQYFIDLDHNNANDFPGQHLPSASPYPWLYLNHSVAAAQTDLATGVLEAMPDPDVPWNAPDHHSPFLYYQATVPQYAADNTTITATQTCILPSYIRYQHLRNVAPATQWYTNAATARLVTRPHREHRSILKNGAIAIDSTTGLPVRRFISLPMAGDPAPSPYTHASISAFPFPTTGNFGIWNTPGMPYTDLDEDLDGDGIKDSIYLDMDLGIYTTPDGTKKFVPIVSAKLVSLDALLNPNKHGNLARGFQSNGTTLPAVANPPDLRIHRSNQGTSRSEINPMYALLATNPGAGNPNLEQHRIYWGGDPSSNTQLANMEYWWLKIGRPQYQGTRTNILSLYPGVYGEVNLMKNASTNLAAPPNPFPAPGTTLTDDNGNRLLSSNYFGTGTVFPNYIGFSQFSHPLDYRGSGDFTTNTTARRLATIQRHVFPQYNNYFYHQLFWPNTAALPLMGGAASYPNVLLFDEPDELRVDAAYANDSPFTGGETVSLHMSDSDRAAVGRDGDRILQLAPYNFVHSPMATIIRRLFTTESWDLPSFSKVSYRYGTAARFRPWEFNETPAGSGVWEFPTTTPDPFRAELRNLLAQRRWDTSGNKPLMRRLSVNQILDTHPTTNQLRFRPLTPHPTGLTSDPISSGATPVVTAPLPTRPELIDPMSAGNTLATKQRQEWLARYDRQRLCRDIYTLLYLYGGGGDIDYATTSNATNSVYSAKQMQDMAQFAVNLVDSMDTDNVITKFEYDTDLSNGWNLDDNPYTDGMDNPAEVGQRGVVYGTEAQTLAFSEALALMTNRTKDAAMMPADHAATEYDDKTHHFFTWIELQNVSPFQVPFDSNWQIRVVAGTVPAGQTITAQEKRLTLTSGAGPVQSVGGGDSASRFVIGTHNDPTYMDPASPTSIARSLFMVNPQHNEPAPNNVPLTPMRLAPYSGNPNLDLMRDAVSNYFINDPPATSSPADGMRTSSMTTDPSGKTLLTLIDSTSMMPPAASTLDGLNSGNVNVRFQLYRRQHLNRSSTGGDETDVDKSKDNPWILVDQTGDIPLQVFHLTDPMVQQAAVRTALLQVRSIGRSQPLDARAVSLNSLTGTNPADPTVPPGNYRLNRLGTVNTATDNDPNLPLVTGVRRFNLWQPHFDRDFASAAELLGVPLYGPDSWDKVSLPAAPPTPGTVTANLGTASAPYKIDITKTATNYFLRPDLPVTNPPTVNNGENRWYRLFELLEVPERNPNSTSPWFVNDLGRFGNVLLPRVAGKMCLNTMSHPALLAGLLDDVNLWPGLDVNANPFLNDSVDARRWWGQFLLARDGRDTTSGGYTLPGVPGLSKPFRELNYSVEGSGSVENTVLRSLPQDATIPNPPERRRLFELGSQAQRTNWQNYDGQTASPAIDVTTRFRPLNKVLNHSTNRSNTFVLILRIDFFEATQVPVSNPSFVGETAVRIGAKLPGAQNPGYLSYYVIDRSKAAALLQQQDLPANVAGRFSWSFRQQMDFSSLILHRQRIR